MMFLLAFDVVLTGCYMLSIFACPIWLMLNLARAATERPGWRVGLVRIAIPLATLGVVLINNAMQWHIAERNADHIVRACEQFRAANGKYPANLGELVPKYLRSVPRAKYCIMWDNFFYADGDDDGMNPALFWFRFPGGGKEHYDFPSQHWFFAD